MTRTFWVILALIVVVVGGFASMLSFGTGAGTGTGQPVAKSWRAGSALAADPVAAGGGGTAMTRLGVPVVGVSRRAITDSWNDTRGGGTRQHHGTDIVAPGGTPVVAAAPGRIEKLFQSRLGGITLYVRSPDRAWSYYYAHLAGYAAGVREGTIVKAGDPLGFVGDTGDAGAGNFHLHFGLARTQPGERWWQGRDVNPYPLLAGQGRDR